MDPVASDRNLLRSLERAAEAIFPYVVEDGDGIRDFRNTYERTIPEGSLRKFSWKVEVFSRHKIEFVLVERDYGLSLTRVVGEKTVTRLEATVSASVTARTYRRRLGDFARDVRRQELYRIEMETLARYASEIDNMIPSRLKRKPRK